MNRIRLLLIAFLLLSAHNASAQITLNGTPLFVDMDLSARIRTENDMVTLSAKIHTNLNRIKVSFDSLIPALNKNFACKIGPHFGGTFSDIGPETELLATNRLRLAATVDVIDCWTGSPLRLVGVQWGVPMGAIRISLPITATPKKFSIKLTPGIPQISQTGLIKAKAALDPEFEPWLRTSAATELNKQVASFEAAINKALLNPEVHKQLQLFQPKIDSILFQSHGLYLGITLQISGRATAAAVSKRLN